MVLAFGDLLSGNFGRAQANQVHQELATSRGSDSRGEWAVDRLLSEVLGAP